IGGKNLASVGIDDANVLIVGGNPAADQHRLIFGAARSCDLVCLQSGARHRLELQARAYAIQAGNHEGRRGKAITGMETGAAESAALELGAEVVQRLLANGFGAVEGYRPTAQVKLLDLWFGDAAHAEVVGEIGSAAAGGAEMSDGLQPARRPLQEGYRRHQGHGESGGERL